MSIIDVDRVDRLDVPVGARIDDASPDLRVPLDAALLASLSVDECAILFFTFRWRLSQAKMLSGWRAALGGDS